MDDTAPSRNTDASANADADAQAWRFALSVWPRTATRAWCAQVRAPLPAAPLRFDRPIDLLIYLTELSDSADDRPSGLR